MKTKNLFKLGLLLIFAMALTGCGQNNRSGGQGNNGGIYGNGAGVPFAGGVSSNLLYQENPCRITGGYNPYPYGQQQIPNARQRVTVRLQGINVAVGAGYVGVTSEGDIASVFNDGSGPVMAMDLCPRGGTVTGQGQLMGNPIVNKSLICQVDEITQARVSLPGMYGQLFLNFRPVHFSGSSLCNGGYAGYPQYPQYPQF